MTHLHLDMLIQAVRQTIASANNRAARLNHDSLVLSGHLKRGTIT